MPMSPVSRGRKGKQSRKTRRGRDLTAVRGTPETCDCPQCSDADADPAELDDLLRLVETVAAADDALDAELTGALFVATVMGGGAELMPIVIDDFIRRIEAKRSSGALTLLLAAAAVSSAEQKQLATAASDAADRLLAAGIPPPGWVDQLAEPVRVGDCLRLSDPDEGTSVLAVPFRRGERGHAFLILVHEMGYAHADILMVGESDLPEALDDIRAGARGDGVNLTTQALDPAELRWYAEQALDARNADQTTAFLDELAWSMSDDDDDEGPPVAALAVLLRRRLADLPKARKPAGARKYRKPVTSDALMSLLGGLTGPFSGRTFERPAPARLPPKRKRSDGPPPIYQIKVGLQGAKPPIWRRLLVPADVSLARLHDVIQVAFGWDGGHLHAFETPYGDFGQADRELGRRAEGSVTLEQVAPAAKDEIRYTYDFGDDWAHDIVVEKVLDLDATLTYPLCTGGRRAAPPDDCGGIWGYQDLMEIIADPRHPEHDNMLDWLDLDDPREFDPEAFNLDEVNLALRTLR